MIDEGLLRTGGGAGEESLGVIEGLFFGVAATSAAYDEADGDADSAIERDIVLFEDGPEGFQDGGLLHCWCAVGKSRGCGVG